MGKWGINRSTDRWLFATSKRLTCVRVIRLKCLLDLPAWKSLGKIIW